MSQACSLSLAACSLIKGRCYQRTGVILQLLQSTNIRSFNQAKIQTACRLQLAACSLQLGSKGLAGYVSIA